MNCHRIQEKLSVYWDLPADDPTRRMIDYHMHHCPDCSAEFMIWRESNELIRSAGEIELSPSSDMELSRQVLERIYQEEAWLRPVLHKSKLRQFVRSWRLTAAASAVACITIFLCSILYLAATGSMSVSPSYESITGFVPAASAADEDGAFQAVNLYMDVPVASISDPIVLKVNHGIPYHLIAIPLIAFMGALLLASWLSATRVAAAYEMNGRRARRKSSI